jgi:hypothetical protein
MLGLLVIIAFTTNMGFPFYKDKKIPKTPTEPTEDAYCKK